MEGLEKEDQEEVEEEVDDDVEPDEVEEVDAARLGERTEPRGRGGAATAKRAEAATRP